jgi:hypothetical protein
MTSDPYIAMIAYFAIVIAAIAALSFGCKWLDQQFERRRERKTAAARLEWAGFGHRLPRHRPY